MAELLEMAVAYDVMMEVTDDDDYAADLAARAATDYVKESVVRLRETKRKATETKRKATADDDELAAGRRG